MLRVLDVARPGLAPARFEVEAGGCVAVMGPSGAGKTLLLRAIADLDPNDGEVELDGHARSGMPAPQWRRLAMYVPAEPGWWAETPRMHMGEANGVEGLLGRLGLPPEIMDAPIARLSTGERQRLALLRALILGPRGLLLDEPTGALDDAARRAAEQVLEERMADGIAIVLVTHDAAQARRLARRTLSMRDGRLSGP